jgi:hypothetical protein
MIRKRPQSPSGIFDSHRPLQFCLKDKLDLGARKGRQPSSVPVTYAMVVAGNDRVQLSAK